jgi:hypothetical protein
MGIVKERTPGEEAAMLRWWVIVSVLVVLPDAHAHIGDRLFHIFELTDEDLGRIDLKDGSADDWRDVLGEPSLTTLDFSIDPQVGDGPTYDPADLDFQIWLGWHQTTSRIYVAMESSDNAYVNQYGGIGSLPGITAYDNMEIMIDGDHTGGEYTFTQDDFSTLDEWIQAAQSQAQLYFATARTPDARHANLLFFDEWYTRPPYVDGGGGVFGEAPTISVIEFYVTPFDRLVKDSQEQTVITKLFPGKIIGFAVWVGDFDTSAQRVHALYLLPPSSLSTFTADIFTDGLLVGAGGTVPDISAVAQDSWGRFKASFSNH